VEAAAVIARLVAFASAVILFGAPLFFLYSLPAEVQRRPTPSTRPVLAGAAFLALLSAAATLVLQTAIMAGDPSAGLDPSTLGDVLGGSAFGVSIIVRLAAAALALAAASFARSGPRLWRGLVGLGAIGLCALAWAGHGAADPGLAGAFHTAADLSHLLAAGVWLGALAALTMLLANSTADAPHQAALHRALEGFSGIGSTVVAVIVATGLVNGWFQVGPDRLAQLLATRYGGLLLLKLAIFTAMLGFAALNRFQLTPALERSLGRDSSPALVALRRSVLFESLAGLGVLFLVAWLGELAPISAA
jgi:putative copper resistance protein D